MDAALFERLLREGEGTALDFKVSQYDFSAEDSKSKFLKDILAFANSWRRTEAYILIGVQESKDGRAIVVGEDKHHDDAHLQQYVRGVANRKVEFAYTIFNYEGKKIGVVRIPNQPRPVYAKRDCGEVKKDLVYYRLGSSTAVASLEDIATMARDDALAAAASPLLELQFADGTARVPLGERLSLTTTVHEMSAKWPDYDDGLPFLDSALSNRNYWRELAAYVQYKELFRPIGFCVQNLSGTLAQNVRVELRIAQQDGIAVVGDDDFPSRPQTSAGVNFNKFANIRPAFQKNKTDVMKNPEGYEVHVHLESIQPKATAWSAEPFYIASKSADPVVLRAKVFADNLGTPVEAELLVNITVKWVSTRMSIDDLQRIAGEYED
jgi:hypothetical protein